MTDNRIVNITELCGVKVRNTHNNVLSGAKDILYVEFANGDKRYLDINGRLDITDVDYLEVLVEKNRTKIKKTLFEEYSVERG